MRNRVVILKRPYVTVLCREPSLGQYRKLFSRPRSWRKRMTYKRSVRVVMRNKNFKKCEAINMKPKHLFSSDHGNDGNTLFPHHLPEVLTRVRQGTLRGNVAPLLSTCCYLMRQDTSHQSQS